MRTIEAPERIERPPEVTPPRSVVRYRIRRISYKTLMYLLLLALCSFILLPVAWMLTAALKPDLEPVFTPTPEWFPTKFWEWDNFRRVLTESMPFLRYMVNTMIIVIGNILGVLLSCSVVGFAFARLRFRGSKVLFYILIVTMLIPWQALMVPQFLFFVKIGWYGTYLPLIIPSFTGTAFFIFLIRQYMRTIPRELENAARIDGCNHFQVFWHIVLPLSKPALATVAIFNFVHHWNDFLGPLIYLTSDSLYTVSLGLRYMQASGQSGISDVTTLMAMSLVATLPTIVLFFFAQKQFIQGIVTTGLKG
jgi:multiple sugar transport system permease protein